eukprot:1675396-Amphidinium_carterae.1
MVRSGRVSQACLKQPARVELLCGPSPLRALAAMTDLCDMLNATLPANNLKVRFGIYAGKAKTKREFSQFQGV